jgi:hypothetical protein
LTKIAWRAKLELVSHKNKNTYNLENLYWALDQEYTP